MQHGICRAIAGEGGDIASAALKTIGRESTSLSNTFATIGG